MSYTVPDGRVQAHCGVSTAGEAESVVRDVLQWRSLSRADLVLNWLLVRYMYACCGMVPQSEWCVYIYTCVCVRV